MDGDGIRCYRTALKNNQTNQTMNIIRRTCATCCAFNPDHTDDDPACSNLVNITIHHVNAAGAVPMTARLHQGFTKGARPGAAPKLTASRVETGRYSLDAHPRNGGRGAARMSG